MRTSIEKDGGELEHDPSGRMPAYQVALSSYPSTAKEKKEEVTVLIRKAGGCSSG
jgi:hypothetical protein